MNRQVDLVIIGAGPGGMTAALYATRSGLSTIMVDASAPGGKLLKTYMVDNYPGCPETPGPDLAVTMFQQSTSFGAEFMNGTVTSVNMDKQVFLENGDVLDAKAVLIATGTRERTLNIKGEPEALGHGESFCAVCDGAFYRGKDVVVIGGGNSALEEALFLTKFAAKVTIIIRRDQFRAEHKIQNMVMENEKIEVIRSHVPEEILLENGKVAGLVIKSTEDGSTMTVPCSGLFPYIGSEPETGFVKDLDILDDKGYVLANEKLETSVDGIYACGDCLRKELRQIVTATADGAVAAQNIFHYVTGI